MPAIQSLCSKCIVLEGGTIKFIGPTDEAINQYLNSSSSKSAAISTFANVPEKKIQISKISFADENGLPNNLIPVNENFSVEAEYEIKEALNNALLCVLFYNFSGELILHSSETDNEPRLKNYQPGIYRTTIKIPNNLFNIGKYYIEVSLQKPFIEYYDLKKNIGFEITDANGYKLDSRWKEMGKISTILNYSTTQLNRL
jgi:lipopolysaccharide transport system ATP-binding protein